MTEFNPIRITHEDDMYRAFVRNNTEEKIPLFVNTRGELARVVKSVGPLAIRTIESVARRWPTQAKATFKLDEGVDELPPLEGERVYPAWRAGNDLGMSDPDYSAILSLQLPYKKEGSLRADSWLAGDVVDVLSFARIIPTGTHSHRTSVFEMNYNPTREQGAKSVTIKVQTDDALERELKIGLTAEQQPHYDRKPLGSLATASEMFSSPWARTVLGMRGLEGLHAAVHAELWQHLVDFRDALIGLPGSER